MTQARLIARPLERWLQRDAPSQAVTLALVYCGMSESAVAAWSRADFDKRLVGELALDLVNAAEDHAQGIGRECRYSLKWLDDEGSTVIAMTWRAGEGLNLNLDGTVESQLAQLQRHNEVQAKQTAQAIGALLDHYQDALGAAQLRIRALEEVRDAFELERLARVTAEPVPALPEESQIDRLVKVIDGMDKAATSIAKVKGLAKAPPAS
jgi:hypothetical protein